MGGFLDGSKVRPAEDVQKGVKFYTFLDVGYGILEEWGYRIRDVFGRGRVLVIHGKRFSREYGERIKGIVGKPKNEISCVVSIGGGSVIDRGKFLAKKLNIPFISIPTLLSSDGIASPVGVRG